RGTTWLRAATVAGTRAARTVRRLVRVVLGRRDEAQHGPRLHPIVLPAPDLDQAAGDRCGHVAGRGAGPHLHQPLPLPTARARGPDPVADDDGDARTGPQVGQDHGRMAHGGPRLICLIPPISIGATADPAGPITSHLA